MALVFVACLPNDSIQTHIRKRFFIFVVKAIDYMNSKAKSILMTKIYQ